MRSILILMSIPLSALGMDESKTRCSLAKSPSGVFTPNSFLPGADDLKDFSVEGDLANSEPPATQTTATHRPDTPIGRPIPQSQRSRKPSSISSMGSTPEQERRRQSDLFIEEEILPHISPTSRSEKEPTLPKS